jgi:hypothetical protein
MFWFRMNQYLFYQRQCLLYVICIVVCEYTTAKYSEYWKRKQWEKWKIWIEFILKYKKDEWRKMLYFAFSYSSVFFLLVTYSIRCRQRKWGQNRIDEYTSYTSVEFVDGLRAFFSSLRTHSRPLLIETVDEW